MKKRYLRIAALILSIALCLSLAGCVQDDGSSKKDINTATNKPSSPSSPSKEDTSEPVEADEPDGTAPDNTTATTIEPQVILDAEGIVVTAKEYVKDSIWGDGIKLLIENNSEKDVGVSADALIVNDYMIDNLLSETVAAGKKANTTLYLLSSNLEAAGIKNVGQIEVYLHLFDADSYTTFYTAEAACIRTSRYEDMDTNTDVTGAELYNDNGVRILGKYVDENSFWGASVLLYIENTSDNNLGISVDDMSINGFMVTPLFYSTVYSGKKSIDDISILKSDLDDNGIETIEEIELKFHIYDADTFSTIADSDPVSFTAG